jgi:hypothetical protein
VAAIYIADSLQRKLESRDSLVQLGARDSVCIRFREACRILHPKFGKTRVEWHELRFEKIQVAAMATFVGHPSERPNHLPTTDDDILDPRFGVRECDDCKVCDNGNHEWCPNDCPQAGW